MIQQRRGHSNVGRIVDRQLWTHLSLAKDAPIGRPIEQSGRIFAEPMVGGLHHRYVRT
jgi:hypothetical protein